MPETDQARASRQRLGTLAHRAARRPNDPEAAAARDDASRAHREQKLVDHIKSLVDQAPPLTPEQRVRLAELLAPQGRHAPADQQVAAESQRGGHA